jgi:hypothetical protein
MVLRSLRRTNAVAQVETPLSFAELEAHAEHIHALAELPPTEMKHFQDHMLLHTMRSNAQVPQSLQDHKTMFVISGSLDILQERDEGTSVYMSLGAGNFCSSSDLQDLNLGAKVGGNGLVMLALPENIWRTALCERQRDRSERIRRFCASLPFSNFDDAKCWPSARLEYYKGGSKIVHQGDPVRNLMWVEMGSCLAVVCSRGDTHVSSSSAPGVVPSHPLLCPLSTLDAGDGLGSLVHAIPDAFSLLLDSRTLRDTAKKMKDAVTPIDTTCSSATEDMTQVSWTPSQQWQWSVHVPYGQEAYIFSIPLKSCRHIVFQKDLISQAKLEARWWIKHLKSASVSQVHTHTHTRTKHIQNSHTLPLP